MSDLAGWLATHDLSRYETVFVENDIDLSVLPHLTDEDLQSLGLSLGHRRKLQAAARALAEPLATSPNRAPVGDEAQPDSATVKPGPRDAEHRQLTVMFCDLVDSTGLSSQLDVESYSGVLRSYQDACTRAVAPFEANVARLFGDGLLIYFGYPHAHEDDAERSVLAAFRIHRALEQLSRKLPIAASNALPDGLKARIGIATGPVVVGDIVGQQVTQQSTALGGTPNLAARLQGLAKAGETVVSSATHRLTERRFQFEPLGQQKVKGLDEPIQVWQATGELSGDSRFDITRSGQMLPMWGREFEQSVLLRYWHTAVGGAGTVVDIRGEAGIGKSRLIRSLREAVADSEHRVFSFQCSAWHSSSSLYPVTSRLLRLAGIAVTDNPLEQRKKLATAFGVLQSTDRAARSHSQAHLDVLSEFLSIDSETTVGESGNNAGSGTSDAIAAIAALLVNEARNNPLLLVFEDTQWIDPSSSALIEALIEQLHGLPILLLLTSREGHGIRVDAVADAPRITLSRLKHTDCHGIIETVCQDRTLPESVVAAILAKTDGVPLFVEELTRTIIESGLLQQHGDRFALQSPLDSLSIPVTIQDSLMARLDRLATVKDLAQTGAVIGREFSHDLLRAVAAISDEQLLSGLGRLIDAGLITERRRAPDVLYVFNHALVQETAYHSLLDSRRRQLHGRIADELIAGFPATVSNQPEWLAYHLDKAGRQREAIEYWQRAAEQARNRSAMHEALSLLGTALEALDTLAEDDDYEQLRFELLTLKITPLITVEGYSTENLEALYLEAIPLYQQLEAAVDLYPLLFARWVRHLNRGMMADALTQAEEVVRFAGEHNNSLMQALGQRLTGAVRVMHGQPEQGCRDLECVLERVDEQTSNQFGFTYGQDFLVATHVNLAIGHNTLGRMCRGRAAAEKALERTEQLNHGLARAFTGGHLGLMAEMTGDAEGLARWHILIHEALQHETMTAWVHVEMGLRGALRYHHRELEESESLLTRCLNATEAIGNRIWKGVWHALLARTLLASEKLDHALEITATGLDHIADGGGAWAHAELLRIYARLIDKGYARAHESRSSGDVMTLAYETACQSGNRISALRCAMDLVRRDMMTSLVNDSTSVLKRELDAIVEPVDLPLLVSAKSLLQSAAKAQTINSKKGSLHAGH